MTRKEIDKFLANTKVYVNGKSKEIQEKLFSLGYMWPNGCTEVKYTECPFLYIYNNHDISYGSDMVNFSNYGHSEISFEEILALELTEPAYRPFKDKNECWNTMLKHEPFGWLKHKDGTNAALIGNVYMNQKVWIVWATNEKEVYSASDLFDDYVFADGEPFGIKEE